jgi:hypothetical protein
VANADEYLVEILCRFSAGQYSYYQGVLGLVSAAKGVDDIVLRGGKPSCPSPGVGGRVNQRDLILMTVKGKMYAGVWRDYDDGKYLSFIGTHQVLPDLSGRQLICPDNGLATSNPQPLA